MTATDPRPVATPRVAAGALFVDEQGRILLVRPTYKSYWDIPGGYVEPGESPLAASEREIHEELGIRVEVGRLLSVDWAPHSDEGDKMLFVFDAGTLSDEQLADIQFRDGEIVEFAFVDTSAIEERTIPRLARRLRATLEARANEQTSYLEGGTVPSAETRATSRGS